MDPEPTAAEKIYNARFTIGTRVEVKHGYSKTGSRGGEQGTVTEPKSGPVRSPGWCEITFDSDGAPLLFGHSELLRLDPAGFAWQYMGDLIERHMCGHPRADEAWTALVIRCKTCDMTCDDVEGWCINCDQYLTLDELAGQWLDASGVSHCPDGRYHDRTDKQPEGA